MGMKANSSGRMARIAERMNRGRGRPPKADKHEAQANFTLPKTLEAQVMAYQQAMEITSRGEVYRQLLMMGLEQARKEGTIK